MDILFNYEKLNPQPLSRPVICEVCVNRKLLHSKNELNIQCKINSKLYFGVIIDNDGMVTNPRSDWRCEKGYSYDNFH